MFFSQCFQNWYMFSKFPPRFFPRQNLSQKSCFCFFTVFCKNHLLRHHTKISKAGSPFFCGCPIDLWYSSFPLPKIFNLRITGYKLITNMLSPCVVSCNAQKQKQVSRSKLIFQIHKQTHSVHNHIPNFRKQLTKE